ncbi:hypothetical protein CEP52_000577 [Fusarium oligoseptatum]|uniref:N-acetyltransferase domain-containing protein n=1 Tax=Fusarium oligoseptatum TaxID=2604345 RepID=A0A428UNN9_9HYPO|nr:hypothetical protein CEP52_000577 [Fusarium oligoseptatum]
MSLPSTKPAQLSIRSFFQAKTPKYAPPPSAALSTPPPPPPPAAAAAAPPPAVSPPSEQEEADDESSTFELPPLPTSLPQEADIRLVSPSDINALRRINALLLPVSYPDNFYQRAVDPAASGRFSRVITWAHDGAEPKVVGGVVCRIEPVLDSKTHGQVPQNLYIQSLCLLSPYRSLGLINAAVDNIIATAVSDSSLDVASVTAHVWTENEEGLKWYEGRGFKKDDQPIRGYYLKLRPDSAWLVHRPVGASVRSSLPSSSSSPAPPSIPASTTAAVVNLPPMSGPPRDGASRPPLPHSGRSYQNQRPETEWNDMPEDMVGGLLVPPGRKAPGSGASSRSSSTARKKRDRSYPAAAFGS